MADFYCLTATPLPAALHGADGDFSIRTLSERERLAIEDFFSKRDIKVSIATDTTAIIIPLGQTAAASQGDIATLVEFGLAVISVSGFQPITTIVTMTGSGCSEASQRSYPEASPLPKFAKKVVKAAASTWIRHLFTAVRKRRDKFHIPADRFVRYSRLSNTRDGLVDLCICLESLIESQTEVSFRFAMCLAKISGLDGAEDVSDMLYDLYEFRSKVVHGADFDKQHKKIAPNEAKLRRAARAILTAYVLYLTEHNSEEWKKYLKSCLLA